MNNKLISCGILLGIVCAANMIHSGDNSSIKKINELKYKYINEQNPLKANNVNIVKGQYRMIFDLQTTEESSQKETIIEIINKANNKVEYRSIISSDNIETNLNYPIEWLKQNGNFLYLVSKPKINKYDSNDLIHVTEIEKKSAIKKMPSPIQSNTSIQIDQPSVDSLSWQHAFLGVGLFAGFCALIFMYFKK